MITILWILTWALSLYAVGVLCFQRGWRQGTEVWRAESYQKGYTAGYEDGKKDFAEYHFTELK